MGDLDLANLDLARLRLLGDRDPDLEDAVGVAGLDRVGVQGLRQPQPPGERAHRALAHEELVVLGPLFLPLPADRQDPAVHGDLELAGVDAGHVKLQRDVALAPHDIQRRGRRRAERVAREPVELTLEVPGERVKPGVVHPCLTSEMEFAEDSAGSPGRTLQWQVTYNSICIFPYAGKRCSWSSRHGRSRSYGVDVGIHAVRATWLGHPRPIARGRAYHKSRQHTGTAGTSGAGGPGCAPPAAGSAPE